MTNVKQDANWDRAIQLFTQKTGIEVNVIAFSGWDELRQKLPVMIAGGVAPDAVYHDNGAQSDLIEKGAMMPIDALVARDRFDLDIWPKPLVDAYRYGGKLYSLPTGVSLYTMYYNVDELASAGLEGLPSDWSAPGFTYDDMAAMAKKLTSDQNGDGKIDQYGLNDFMTKGIRALLLWDKRWLNPEQTKFLGTNPDILDIIGKLSTLWIEDKVIGGNFLAGTAAMTPVQPNYLNTLGPATAKSGAFKWSLGVLPKVVCRCTPTGFHSWGIAEGAKHPEAAWSFIKFITTDPEGALYFNRAENRIPVLRSVQKAYVSRWEQQHPGMHAEVLTQGINHVVRELLFTRLPIDVYKTILGGLTKVMSGAASPKNAMSEIQPAVEALLAKAQAAR